METYAYIYNDIRTFVEGLISNYTILDYGIVISAKQDSVTVQLSAFPMQKNAVSLPRTLKDVRLVYPSSKNFSIRWKIETGDRVLLLGLKNYISDLSSKVPEQGGSIHYDIENLIAYPVSSFEDMALVSMDISNGQLAMNLSKQMEIEVKEGDIKITATKGKIEINAPQNEVVVNSKTATVKAQQKCSITGSGGVEIKGASGTISVK